MASVAAAADLRIRAGFGCDLLVDGRLATKLEPGETVQVSLAAGKHRLEAISEVAGARWEKVIEAADGGVEELRISSPAAAVVWSDSKTGEDWTLADNGSGLSWRQALRYCKELALGGFRDWTLPAIDQLQGLFDPSQNQAGYHIRAPLKLTGWEWSATPGEQKGEGWALDFGDGGRASVPDGDSGLNRALCVRKQK